MAAYALAAPGSPNGPCLDPCEHTDCDETRRMAAALCRYCSEPIGYEVRAYYDPGEGYAHAPCAWRAANAAMDRHHADR